MKKSPTYLSDSRPKFAPCEIDCGKIPAYRYKGNLASELKAKTITPAEAVAILEDMLVIRELEEMIVKLRSGAYEPIRDFNYRGPTHVSVGQEGTAAGACCALQLADNITSTHRGHGESLAKGTVAIRQMTDEQLRKRVPNCKSTKHEDLVEAALEEHVYRTICELFGKDDGYCRGRGGSMHIADFTVGHLGANAIVGGGVPIATGAALANRYLQRGNVVCCFAGDGAYANGVVLESLNFAAQAQFTNHLADGHKFGLPIIFLVCNNHYGMTHRSDDEVMGVDRMARRAGRVRRQQHARRDRQRHERAGRARRRDARRASCAAKAKARCSWMWTATATGAIRSAIRATSTAPRKRKRPGRRSTPSRRYKKELLDAGVLDAEGHRRGGEARGGPQRPRRQARRRRRRSADAKDVLTFMYTDTKCETVPAEFAKVELVGPLPEIKRVNGELTYKDALKEALVQEMARDKRVVFYGEDVADYGGAFKVTKGLLEAFGRDRVFNTPISEACICGTGCGAAMNGLRPVVELMYFDFALMSSDQISNQAAKWHYMSGAQTEVPLVIRCLGRRRQRLRRAAFADARIHVLPHPRPVRGLSRDARTTRRACSSRRFATTTRSCSSSRRRSTA